MKENNSPQYEPTRQARSISHRSFLLEIANIFKRDFERHDGVPRINIYLLRLLFALMFFFLSYDAWSHIIFHTGQWDNTDAAAWCMWGSYAMISFIGILRPLKMLPIVLFEIVYKTAWLIIVSYPLWIKNELIGSPAEGMTRVFIWVVFPILAMPWKYFFKTYLMGKRMEQPSVATNE